ncbi:chemotaxis protein CheR [Xaviernesmea oryzae]|uniref:Chemotaxis protein methyltransferase n=1 Tax=Xaviernesmea oryzae TaxID=464029 RepID=A0A1Q9AST8_9HYPH|nr:CheR family methyltransferase [Xaviernesmea oryzae]OLP58473.1 chemotaxis protein CheR [Xaviernesmea oryzae]SEK57982.1 chemotaxis protein methyltransferase CheR [Xaviernesmea oryzae]
MSEAAVRISADDRLSQQNFNRLSTFIFKYSGIKMPPSKITMLEGRLRRRLRATGYSNFDAYCQYLFKGDGLESETIHLIDAVTTNKTDFFRESNHFDYMASDVLPHFKALGTRKLRVWSSACSIGAEPYTLAMVLEDYRQQQRGPDYQILATDLSTDVLQRARKGIYSSDMVVPVPRAMRSRYVMTAIDPERDEVRIVPQLRANVGFMRLNLMDESYRVGEPMHIIFCRNVLIYFDKKTQQHVLSQLCECLAPGGYLFIGHSETVAGLTLPIRQIANTIFIRE